MSWLWTLNVRDVVASLSPAAGGSRAPSLGWFEALESRQLLSFDPSPLEQAMLEDVNRMRMDPQGELDVLFTQTNPLRSADPDVQGALSFFRVDPLTLLEQWSELEPVPPVAWNEHLIDAAFEHNLKMIEFDEQSHQLEEEPELGERVREAGYNLALVVENVYAFGRTTFQSHAGFVVDWGESPTGIQDPPGHRINMMNPHVQEIGISVIGENDESTDVGPLVITQNLGRPPKYIPQVLGVVYRDNDSNGRYDAGEGLPGVEIEVTGTGGTFTTTSMSAGGYQLHVPNGSHTLIASGGALAGPRIVTDIEVAGENVKVDIDSRTALRPPVAVNDTATTTEDTSVLIDILANDGDIDGVLRPSTVEIISPPFHGDLTTDTTSGSVRYVPDADFFGSDRFTYRVFDDDGAPSKEATVSITVGAVNDAPRAVDDQFVIDEDTVARLNVLSNDVDVDGRLDSSSIRVVRRPSHGTVQLNSSSDQVLYEPETDFTGTDWFTYTIRDNDGAVSDPARVQITVLDVNDLPLAVADHVVTRQDRSIAIDVLANDLDPDGQIRRNTVGLTRFPQNGHVGVNRTTGILTYTPSLGYFGSDSFGYAVRDTGMALSAEATVSIIVTESEYPWHNPVNPLDVNNDGEVVPLDALLIINDIVKNGPRRLGSPADPDSSLLFFDANRDGFVSAIDALLVINQLHFRTPSRSRPSADVSTDPVVTPVRPALSASAESKRSGKPEHLAVEFD